MAKFAPPSPLDFGKPQSWPEWKQRFQRYRVATKLTADDGTVQVNTLIYAMGVEAESAFRTFTFDDDADKDDYDVVLSKFDSYFAPQKNTIHERAMFNTRQQQSGESAEAFIRALFDLAEMCDFGDQKEDHIRDRIVTGLLDKNLSRDLQMKADLNLTMAVQMVKQSETVKAQLVAQGQSLRPTGALDEVRQPRPGKHGRGRAGGQPGKKCGRCGYKHDGRPCPAKG